MPLSTRPRRGARPAALLVCTCLLPLAAVLSLAVGAAQLGPGQILAALHHAGDPQAVVLVWQWRLPRTLVAALVGLGLAVAGALMQAFSRNPLADPGILGVNAGAALAVILGIWVGYGSPTAQLWLAVLGALLTTVAVQAVALLRGGAATPLRTTLAGFALGAVLTGIGTAIRLFDQSTFEQVRAWSAGSTVGRSLSQIAPAACLIGLGLVVALATSPALNALALGDDVAASLGVRVATTRVAVVAAIVALAGGATALAGPIGFVGLMAPHALRRIVGPDLRYLLPAAALGGPVVVLFADTLARVIVPGELPVGTVTAFIGGPVLVALVRRRTGIA